MLPMSVSVGFTIIYITGSINFFLIAPDLTQSFLFRINFVSTPEGNIPGGVVPPSVTVSAFCCPARIRLTTMQRLYQLNPQSKWLKTLTFIGHRPNGSGKLLPLLGRKGKLLPLPGTKQCGQ